MRYDYERAIMVSLLPRRQRPLAWVLLAFNYELAKTREAVTEPTLGLIRLQWWREALQRLFAGHVDAHVVTQALSQNLSPEISFDLFDRMITARQHDMQNEAVSTIDDVWQYCADTTAPLLQMLGAPQHEAETAGACYAMLGLIRALLYQDALRKKIIPSDIVVRDLCQQVRQRLIDLKTENRMSRLYVAAVKLHLKNLARCGYDVKDPRTAMRDPLFAFKMWWSV